MDLPQIEAYLPKDGVQRAVITALGLSTVYVLGLVIHRLFICPLSKFPGPKLAAITSWYELYYDVVKQGQFLWEIERMHDKYGMCLCSPDHRQPYSAQDLSMCYQGKKLIILKLSRANSENQSFRALN